MKFIFKSFLFQFLTKYSFLPLIADSYFLTDPFLQVPTTSSVNVVWFTELAGNSHFVEYGAEFTKTAVCNTTPLTRIRENSSDGHSCTLRPIYRHEAVLENLHANQKTPYRAVSIFSEKKVKSEIFFCSPVPTKGMPLKILFTSDHQGKPMVAANLQKIKEVVPAIDAIFFAGDCADRPDKGSDWFDKNGFFACLQGRAKKELNSPVYAGGALLQFAPMFCAIGNHEIMGRWTLKNSIDAQYNDPYPRKLAEQEYNRLFSNQNDDVEKEKWIKNHSFNSDSFDEIFTTPKSAPDGKKYYAITFGDIRLVVLHATRIWRNPTLGIKGKYTESPESYSQPEEWGHGDFIYESIEKGSAQYEWLEKELQSSEFQNAKYKIVMLHNPLHSLGENGIPPFTDPIQKIEKNSKGEITEIRYEYLKSKDYLIRDIEPLLTKYGVDLVLCGHTHIWNRFQSPAGVNYIETSNVGNSYGGYLTTPRLLVPGKGDENYVACGDPNGLEPILPTIAPLVDSEGKPVPYIASNSLTVFSIFSTDTGFVDSYYFDTTQPNSSVIHFDRFHLKRNEPIYETPLSFNQVQENAQSICRI